ncbi:MAG: PstS family phosphate ABC transporter substrate-binding protein [Dehalococcoidia bacterium]|nr:PstS family phosphate ABC transporter substrate-binding protein [Dehalococcoidia bacterium]
MRLRIPSFAWQGAAVAAAVLLGAACSGTSTEPKTTTDPTSGTKANLSGLAGELRIDGSSTVFPISEAVAEEFGKAGAKTRVNVAFSGTGGGFEKFCRGEIEVSDASRKINDREKAACANAGINDVLELQVAIDALTVMVNPRNNFVTCLKRDELKTLFSVNGPTTWNQLRPEFPNQPIKFYFPGTDSGTFDYFREAIITTSGQHRGDGTASEDDNVLAQGIENDPNAIGYFGFAYFLEAGQRLKAVEVDGGNGCVKPSFDNALSGAYVPLSRGLFIYTRESFLKERPEVKGFVQFYLENTNRLSKEVGYISLPDALLQQQTAKVQ